MTNVSTLHFIASSVVIGVLSNMAEIRHWKLHSYVVSLLYSIHEFILVGTDFRKLVFSISHVSSVNCEPLQFSVGYYCDVNQ